MRRTTPYPLPLLSADVHTHRGWGRQNVSDKGQEPLQDQLQGGAPGLDIALGARWMESYTDGPRAERTRERGPPQMGHGGVHAYFHSGGSGVWRGPYLSYLLCRSFSICGSTVVHRSNFHRELKKQLGVMPSASPDHPALLLLLRPLTLSG